MTILCLQPDVAWHDKPANHAAFNRLLDGVDVPAGSLIVLPEMCDAGFSMDVPAVTDGPAGGEPGPTAAFLSSLAADHAAYVLGGVVTTAPDGRGLNQAALFAPDGREVGRYAKTHPFTYAGERDHYAAGGPFNAGPVVFDLPGGVRLAPFVCYDLRFPETFRPAVAAGANLVAVIANWPSPRVGHWLALLRARAIENQCYVAGVNRVGRDPNVPSYPGRSMVINPRGEVIADAGGEPGVIRADLDVAAMNDYRAAFPFLADM